MQKLLASQGGRKRCRLTENLKMHELLAAVQVKKEKRIREDPVGNRGRKWGAVYVYHARLF